MSKNYLTAFSCQELGREKNHAFSCTRSVLAKNMFWTKNSGKPGKTIKIGVSAEIAQNQTLHLFYEKGVFYMGEKVGFTNCVFEKLCSSENTIFIVFRQNTAVAIKKLYVEENRKLMKIVACFRT